MARRKSPAQRAPQSLEEATTLMNRFAELDAQYATIQEERKAGLATINAAADSAIVPLIAELNEIEKQLKPWWAASIDDLTGGKRKSMELGGCMIGYRINPPKVVFERGTEKDGVAALQKANLIDMLRISAPSLDKAAIMKALDGETEALAAGVADEGEAIATPLHDMGFKAKQTEDFFVERVAQGGTLTA